MEFRKENKILQIELNNSFTIYEVELFRDSILKELNSIEQVKFNGLKVKTIDTIGIQTIYSLQKYLLENNIIFEKEFSEQINKKFLFLGLDKL
jgi:anti-anti-sigma regulatory factor